MYSLCASISDASCIRVNDSPPSYFKDSSGNWVRFVLEQGNAVITEARCKVEYRSAPWARALRLPEQGEIDMMELMSFTEERKNSNGLPGWP
ncbi:MAG: transporter substrate-binding domain-containing protein [Proteobacteria bacterium]|nr:transporter substrate-binding domain-containing protein [Pseudomonadota bacterium]